jgi:hypothetical protein
MHCRSISVNMSIRRETPEKARRSLAFSPVSKPHTHITYMLRQCTRIVYIAIYLWCWLEKGHWPITQVFVTSSNMTKLLVYTVKSQKCVYLQVIKIRIKSSSFVHIWYTCTCIYSENVIIWNLKGQCLPTYHQGLEPTIRWTVRHREQWGI